MQALHERGLRERDIATLRAQLSERDFERATAQGELMPVAAAVTSALAFTSRRS